MLGIISMFIVGLIAGAIARAVVPGKDPMGCLGTALLGIVGSFIGGTLASVLFDEGFTEIRATNLIGSIIGAIILLLILRMVSGRRSGRGRR